MPKLKKYSEIQPQSSSHSPVDNDQNHSPTKASSESGHEDDLESEDEDKKKRVSRSKSKKSRKSKKSQKEEAIRKADEILKTMQEQFADNEDSKSQGYIPVEVDKQQKTRKRKNKQSAKNIKVKSKYFSDMYVGEAANIETDICEIQLQVKAKSYNAKENAEKFKNRFQTKIDKIKNRHEHKNYTEDPRYKEEVKRKLNDMQNYNDDDDLNIVLEMPKVFAGPNTKQANAAMLLKSQPLSQTSNAQEEPKAEEVNKKTKINRASFYKDFNKEIKGKRAIAIEKKDLFRKSSLQDFDKELSNHQYLFKDNQRNDENSRLSQGSNSNYHKHQISQSLQRNSNQDLSKKQARLPTSVEEEQETSNSVNQNIRKVKSEKIQVKKMKEKKKLLRNLAEKYVEEEAEDSDVSGYNRNGQESDEDDDGDVSSLIDYDYKEKKNQVMNIKKFIQKQEKEKHLKMMQNLKDHFSRVGKAKAKENSSEKKRRKRMKDARKKYQIEDGTGQDNEIIKFQSEKKNQKQQKQEKQTEGDLKNQFETGLQQLQEEIYGRKQEKSGKKSNKKRRQKTNIWEKVKLKERKPGQAKRGGFSNGSKLITGSRIHTPKRKSRDNKEIKFENQ